MNILEFIFGILVLIVVFIIGIGIICTKWNTQKLEDENNKLKEELQAMRERKVKREYKKAKEVK